MTNHQTKRFSLFSSFTLTTLLGAIVISQAGCAVVAWTAAQFKEQEKIRAFYHPPKDKRFLVLVESRTPLNYPVIKIDLAERINKILIEKELAASIIPHEMLANLSAARKNYNQMAISEIGEALGADVVLYVEIDEFSLRESRASPLWQGRLSTSIWLVASPSGERLWPDLPPRMGQPVDAVKTETVEESSRYYGRKISEELADMMASKICKFFYDHKVGDV